jgi:hypothetical protein
MTNDTKSYAPLALQHSEWSLTFYSKPEYKVVATGRTPTIDEMLDILCHVAYPAACVYVFIAAHVTATKAQEQAK